MSIEEFKEYVKGRCPLDTEEIHRFMDEMSDRARRVTFRLNTAYHTPFTQCSVTDIVCRENAGITGTAQIVPRFKSHREIRKPFLSDDLFQFYGRSI